MSFTKSKARVIMLRSFLIFLSSLFGLSTNAAASGTGDWVVPEKRLSAATGLSDSTRAVIESVGGRARLTKEYIGDDPRKEILELDRQIRLEEPVTQENLEGMFNVKIQIAELAEVGVYKVSPGKSNSSMDGRVFLHIHGGGFALRGGIASAFEGSAIASTSGIDVISVDYTLSTESPFPAALNELVVVYQELLKTLPAKLIAVGGSSAGGNLTLALVHKLKALGLPVPGALYVGTPNIDFLYAGDTIVTNEYVDNTIVSLKGFVNAFHEVYAGDHDLKNPLISPIYGDFSGFPPTYLVSGTRDLFLSDTVRAHRKLRDAGVVADLNVFEGVPHGAYLVPGSGEYNAALGDLKKFLQIHL